MKKTISTIRTLFLLIPVLLINIVKLNAGDILIGAASVDITPELPVALTGQFHLRIAEVIETPLTANIIALESKENTGESDAAIMVSCDLLNISNGMLQKVREEVGKIITGLDVSKIFLSATHTHTAPVLENDSAFSFRYAIPEKGVLQVDEYVRFFVKQVSDGIIKAWNSREPGSVTWGLSHAAIAYNRRAVYADGTAVMYGNTNRPDFLNLEGTEDHDVNTLFFWDNDGKLTAMAINVPCPSQVVEHRSAVNADYWHPVREKLKQRFGMDVTILGWGGASGDQSPRPLYRKKAEARMNQLRGLSDTEELARRICMAVEDAFEAVKNDRHEKVKLIHKTEILSLPVREVTQEEYLFSLSEKEKYSALIAANPESAKDHLARVTWNADVVKRYNMQKNNPNLDYKTEIHVVRIGDIALCTNQFELFTDYGLRIQARSEALQTFVIAFSGPVTYLPTEKAVKGGGYSAVIQSGVVGPEGGQIMVERTVQLINEMF
mgnify:CR=1 FL=1|jgi:hypothetical protein